MGNLKKMFYKDYYSQVDYEQFAFNLDDEKLKSLKEKNAKNFDQKNTNINDYSIEIDDNRFRVLDKSRWDLEFSPLYLTTTYPGLIIGSGYKHEMHTKKEYKLGFFFDHTTGLPMLPGSSVKGVLRSAFPNFSATKNNSLEPDFDAKGKKGLKITEKQKQKAFFIQELVPALEGLEDEALFTKVHQLEWVIFEGLDIAATQEKKIIQRTKMSQRCVFYDAYTYAPAPNGKIVGGDVLTPHGDNPLKNPNPLPFLKVLPEVTFQFSFGLQDIKVEKLNLTKDELKNLFKDILMFLGMGAKTNVGYGQFTNKHRKPVRDAITEFAIRNRPKNIIPSNIPNNTAFESAKLVKIRNGYCAFQFDWQGQTFQIIKTIVSITKKWLKRGCDKMPIAGKTYRIVLQADIVIGQKNPNFSVSKPKEQ